MRVLLVEPAYRRLAPETKRRSQAKSDETLWYPPLGLMKLSRFHKDRGDEVVFAYGCDKSIVEPTDDAPAGQLRLFETWDRVYVTTLFTFEWRTTIETIKFYVEAAGRAKTKVFVGGVMASLMPDDILAEIPVRVVTGVLTSPEQIGLPGDVNIDLLPPDYELVDPSLYATNDTYYGYTSRGCVNECPWCGVPRIEPQFIPYIDIKPTIRELRRRYGDKPILKLMDNNVLASPKLARIVDDLVELGYGREASTDDDRPRQRVLDFNQGIDARHLTDAKMQLLARLHISPMRIAFDQLRDKKYYVKAVALARQHGVTQFSNYMLFNFHDTPGELYERLRVNIEVNEQWRREEGDGFTGGIYSYPMRYAPIDESEGAHANRERDYLAPERGGRRDLLNDAVWNRRFIRNVGVMSGAAHGAISPTPSLAWRTLGATYEEFIANLYMPEAMLRNRNRYERRVYPGEPRRKQGTGDVEAFRAFILGRLKRPNEAFVGFHHAVGQNRRRAIQDCLKDCTDAETRKWLEFYLKK
jgi:hypothetical protein